MNLVIGTGSGGGGAPTDAQYVVLVANATLTQERVLTGTANQVTITDGGAGAAVTLALPQDYDAAATPTLGGLTLNGALLVRSQNEVRWYDNGNYVGFEAGALGANQIWVLPTADGGVNEFLQTDGGGNLTWAAGGGAPGGANKQVQYNNAAAFGGATGFEWQSADPNVLIIAQNAAHVPLAIKAAAAQTANLTEWQDSAGNVALAINSDGDLFTDRWLAQDSNTFIGVGVAGAGNLAHAAGSEGYYNCAVGMQVLEAITVGYQNMAFGWQAAQSVTSGYGNVAIGAQALQNLTTGFQNMAIGFSALLLNNGDSNIAIGAAAMRSNTTGAGSTGIGAGALYDNTSGGSNVAIGTSALPNNTTASRTTAVGVESLNASNKNGGSADNTGIGYRAGSGITTGYWETCIGASSGDNLTTGAGCISIGYGVQFPSVGGNYQLVIGTSAGGTYIESDGTDLTLYPRVAAGSVIIKGRAAQTAALLQLQDSTGGVVVDSGDGLAASEFVFNQGGIDIDFRVESATYNAILVDADQDELELMSNAAGKIGFFGQAPRVQIDKASFNNWAAFTDVVDALVAIGLFDAA